MKQLAVQSAEGRNGEIVVKLNGDDGPYEVALSVFDVSTLVSMLYAARAEVANQPVPSAPEAALPLHTIKIGDDADHEIMRVYVTEVLYHDYGARKGTPAANLVADIARGLASKGGSIDES